MSFLGGWDAALGGEFMKRRPRRPTTTLARRDILFCSFPNHHQGTCYAGTQIRRFQKRRPESNTFQGTTGQNASGLPPKELPKGDALTQPKVNMRAAKVKWTR
ncbi:uncharacterized protein BBA_03817 [Beauveria bassiana ARSEF 2860]|uniref:Uncharacterized protein n=1 Tax=Beauveria bassiana (strain ARSEF 2860) TaxID=655819 RepID=J5JQE3_BEAB2|nr:uncharacterized protein BBA_03817 [Beauveria bassiana ARSEF 2860]EJP67243.1 hypothetical protein BBA_03817 [Beauveria bassiana ARSEF 2860]